MSKQRELPHIIYDGLKNGDIESVVHAISKELEKDKTDKMGFTKTPLLNSIGKNLGKLILKDGWKFEALIELWKNGGRDERLIVIGALGEIGMKDYEGTKLFVLEIIEDISDWEICDQLALKVVSRLAVKNQKEIFSFMDKWIESEGKWVRRLAVATIPPYIRAEPESSSICLGLLEKVMKEGERDVKKAVAWALREITKKDPEAVFVFLRKWAKIGDENTEWIIRNGMKKLGEKERKELESLIK